MLTIPLLQPSDAVITDYCIPSDLTWKLTASLQFKNSAAIVHYICQYRVYRNITYILKVEYSPR